MTVTTMGTSSAKLQAGGEREDRGNTSTYTRRGLFRAGKPIKRSDRCCLRIRSITLFLALGLRSVALKSHFQAGQLHESPGGHGRGNGNMKQARQAHQPTGTSHFNRKWIEACHGTSRDDTWSGAAQSESARVSISRWVGVLKTWHGEVRLGDCPTGPAVTKSAPAKTRGEEFPQANSAGARRCDGGSTRDRPSQLGC